MILETVNHPNDGAAVLHVSPTTADVTEQDKCLSTFAEADPDRVVLAAGDAATLYKPDGHILAVVCRGVLDRDAMASAFGVLKKYTTRTDLRSTASGFPMQRDVKKDGTLSNTLRVNRRVHELPISGVMGYFDRFARIPYCRKASFNRDKPEQFAKVVPLLRSMDSVYRAALPDRYSGQLAAIGGTHDDWRISDTAYTTMSVNRNFRTAYHRDSGDLCEPEHGASCLAVMWGGKGSGGNLVLPFWNLEVEYRSGDLILMDSHEVHGNMPIIGRAGQFERISVVAYYRTGMLKCGSGDEELQRAKSIETDRAERRLKGEL